MIQPNNQTIKKNCSHTRKRITTGSCPLPLFFFILIGGTILKIACSALAERRTNLNWKPYRRPNNAQNSIKWKLTQSKAKKLNLRKLRRDLKYNSKPSVGSYEPTLPIGGLTHKPDVTKIDQAENNLVSDQSKCESWLDDEPWVIINARFLPSEPKIEVTETEVEEDLVIGGSGDCWRQLTMGAGLTDDPLIAGRKMTATELIAKLLHDPWGCGVPNEKILFSWQDDGDLHIENKINRTMPLMGIGIDCACQENNWSSKAAPCRGCVTTAEFIEILKSKKKKTLVKKEVVLEDSGIGLCDYLESYYEYSETEGEDVVIGAIEDSILKNDFFEKLESLIGDDIGQKYREAIGDHDNRVVNNTFARFKYDTIRTSRPSRKLATKDFKTLNTYLMSTNHSDFEDNDLKFLMDITTTYCYLNTVRSKTTFDDETLKYLNKQEFFEDNVVLEDSKYYVGTDPDFSAFDNEFVMLIGPVVPDEGEGALYDELGWYKAARNCIWYNIGSGTKAKSVGPCRELLYSNSTVISNTLITVVSRKVFGPMQVVCCTRLAGNYVISNENDKMTFDIPIFSGGLFATKNIDLIRLERRTLHRKLITRLMNMNITGKVGDEKMLEYAMALTWYSYNKRGVEIMERSISAEDAYTHVYVAKMLLTRQKWYDNIFELVNTSGLTKVATSALAAMVSHVTENKTVESAQLDIVKQVIDALKEPRIRSSTGVALEKWCSIDCWTNQASYTVVSSSQWHACKHHMVCPENYTGRICNCCGGNTAGLNMLCICCYRHTENCYHDCMSEHKEGTMSCICCEKPSTEKICDCCSLENRPNESYNEINRYAQHHHSRPDPRSSSQTGPTTTTTKVRPKPASEPPHKCTFSKVELSAHITPSALAILYDNQPLNYQISASDSRLSVIPFITNDRCVISNNAFDSEVSYDPSVGDCGIAVLRWFLRDEFSMNAVGKITKSKTENLSALDISEVLAYHGLNSIIKDNTGCYVRRKNPTEEFACIDNSDGNSHWVTVMLKRKKDFSIAKYPFSLSTSQEHESCSSNIFRKNIENCTNDEIMTIGYTLGQRVIWTLDSNLDLPQFKDNKFFNSSTHDPRSGKFNVTVPDQYATIMSTLCDCIKLKQSSDLFNEVYDVSEEQLIDVEYNARHTVLSDCLSICDTIKNPTKSSKRLKVDGILIKPNTYKLDVSKTKLKNGDLIHVMESGSLVSKVVTVTEGSIIVKSKHHVNFVDLIVPVKSYMSTIMEIISLIEICITTEQLKNILTNASVVQGVAGSGKSTKIAEMVKTMDSVTVAACTSGGVRSLIAKCGRNTTVTSVEKLSYNKCNDKCLILDEATLLHPWKIALIAKNPSMKLWLFGDELQIPAVDFQNAGGTRLNRNLLTHASRLSRDVTKMWNTYRMGNPLVDELSDYHLLNDLKSVAPHETVVDLHYLTRWDMDKLADIIGKVNVVLCHYNDHVDKLFRFYSGSKRIKSIQTIHSFQGQESDSVVIIQSPLGTSGANIHVNPRYNISAATRAVKKLIWISIECFSSNTKLIDRFGGTVGSRLTEITWNGDTLPRPSEQLKVEGTDYTKTFNFKQFAGEIQSELPAINLKLTHLSENKIEINARLLVATASMTKVHGQKLMVSENIEPYIDKLESLIDDCMTGSSTLDEIHVVPRDKRYRCRILGWIVKVYQCNNRVYKFEHCGIKYKVTTENNECAACCALIFTSKYGSTKVHKDYITSEARIISGYEPDTIQSIIESKDCDLFDPKFDSEVISHAILAERVSTCLKEVPHQWSTLNKMMWYDRFDNEILKIDMKQNYNTDIKVTGYDDMLFYPVFIKKRLGKDKVSVFEDGERKVIIKNSSKMDYIYSALMHLCMKMKNKHFHNLIAKTYIGAVGSKDALSLPGMIESVDWHKQHKTKAYYNLIERVGAVRISSIKRDEVLKYVPENVYQEIRKITDDYRFASNNVDSVLEPKHEAFDFITVASMRNEGMQIDYSMRTSYATYLCEQNNNKVINTYHDGHISLEHKLLEANYDRMLRLHIKRLAADSDMYTKVKRQLEAGDVWNGKSTNARRLVLGPECANFTAAKWAEIVSTYDFINFWFPNAVNVADKSLFGRMEQCNSVYPIRASFYKAMSQGTTLNFNGNRYVIHRTKYYGDASLFTIEAAAGNAWLQSQGIDNRWISVDVPMIVLDPIEMLSKGTILETKTMKVNLFVLGNLRRRLLRPDTTFDDLLVQIRTLQNSVSYSTNSVNSRFDLNEHEIYDTGKIAWLMHKHMMHKYKLISGEYDVLHHLILAAESFIGRATDLAIPRMKYRELIDVVKLKFGSKYNFKLLEDFTDNLDKLSSNVINETRDLRYNGDLVVSSVVKSLNDKLHHHVKYLRNEKPPRYFVNSNCRDCHDLGLNNLNFLSSADVVYISDKPENTDDIQLLTKNCLHFGALAYRIVGTDNSKTDFTIMQTVSDLKQESCLYLGLAGHEPVSSINEYPIGDLIRQTPDGASYANTSGTVMINIVDDYSKTLVYFSKNTVFLVNSEKWHELSVRAGSNSIIVVKIGDSIVDVTRTGYYDFGKMNNQKLLGTDFVQFSTYLPINENAETIISSRKKTLTTSEKTNSAVSLTEIEKWRSASDEKDRFIEKLADDGYIQSLLPWFIPEDCELSDIYTDGSNTYYKPGDQNSRNCYYVAITQDFAILHKAEDKFMISKVLGTISDEENLLFSDYYHYKCAHECQEFATKVELIRGVCELGHRIKLTRCPQGTGDSEFAVDVYSEAGVRFITYNPEVEVMTPTFPPEQDENHRNFFNSLLSNGVESNDMQTLPLGLESALHDLPDLGPVNACDRHEFGEHDHSCGRSGEQHSFRHNKWDCYDYKPRLISAEKLHFLKRFMAHLNELRRHDIPADGVVAFSTQENPDNEMGALWGGVRTKFSRGKCRGTKYTVLFNSGKFERNEDPHVFEIDMGATMLRFGACIRILACVLWDGPCASIGGRASMMGKFCEENIPYLDDGKSNFTINLGQTFMNADGLVMNHDISLENKAKIISLMLNNFETYGADEGVADLLELDKFYWGYECQNYIGVAEPKSFTTIHNEVREACKLQYGKSIKSVNLMDIDEKLSPLIPPIIFTKLPDTNNCWPTIGLIDPKVSILNGSKKGPLGLAEPCAKSLHEHVEKCLETLKLSESYEFTNPLSLSTPLSIEKANLKQLANLKPQPSEIVGEKQDGDQFLLGLVKNLNCAPDPFVLSLLAEMNRDESVPSVRKNTYLNPILAMSNKRIAECKNLLSGRVHCLDEDFARGIKPTVAMRDFLFAIHNKVKALNSDKDTIWYVTSMDENIATRSLPMSSRSGKVRFLNFTSAGGSQMSDQLGFESIEFSGRVGRMGANLRFMLPILLNGNFKEVHILSGRPGLHALAAEAVNETISFAGNSVACPTADPGPFLDGMVIREKIDVQASAVYMRACLSYPLIYGIDECNWEVFNITGCCLFPQSTGMYSNCTVSGAAKLIKQRSEIKVWPDNLLPQWFQSGVSDRSMVCYPKYLEVAAILDENLPKHDSRNNGQVISCDEAKVLIELIKQSREQTSLNLYAHTLHKKNVIDPKRTKVNLDNVTMVGVITNNHLYDPEGADYCVAKVITRCLRNYGNQVAFSDVTSLTGVPRIVKPEQIIGYFNLCNLNVILLQGKSGKWSNLHDGEIFVVKIVEGTDGNAHLVLHRVIEQKDFAHAFQINSKLDLSELERTSQCQLNGEHIAMDHAQTVSEQCIYPNDKTYGKRLKIRMAGRPDLIIKRNGGWKSLDDGVEYSDGVNGKWIISNKLKQGNTYLTINIGKFEPRLAVELNGKAAIHVDVMTPKIVGNINVSCSARQLRPRIVDEVNFTFLNQESKNRAEKQYPEISIYGVGANVQNIIVIDTDNRNHHNNPEHDKLVSGTRLLTMKEGRLKELPNFLFTKGKGVNIGMVDCGFQFMINVRQDYYNCFANHEFIDDSKTEARYFATGLGNWDLEGNTYVPKPSIKNYLELYEVENIVETEDCFEFDAKPEVITNIMGHATGFEFDLQSVKDYDGILRVTVKALSKDETLNPWDSKIESERVFTSVTTFEKLTFSPTGKGKPQTVDLGIHLTIDDLPVDKNDKVFGKIGDSSSNSGVQMSDDVLNTIKSLDMLNGERYEDSSDSYKVLNYGGKDVLLTGSGVIGSCINGDVVEEMIPPNVIDYWRDETAMLPLNISLPHKNIKLRSNPEFAGIKKVSKAITTEYPSHSQSAFPQRMGAGLQAVSDLFGSNLVLRQVEHDPVEDARLFAETYFDANALRELDEVTIDPKDVYDWIKERPDGTKIGQDLLEVVSEGMDVNGLNKVNVHMKLESRMKDVLMYEQDNRMPGSIEEQRVRLIVWQRKGITAIFSPFFKRLKENLKRLLRKDVIYADGLTPEQLSATFNKFSKRDDTIVFAEDDLKKQDRQTDMTLINTEMEIYKILGGKPSVVNMWHTVHKKWRAKGIGLKFEGDASRHTGQATTALGNVIVNLNVKGRLVRELSNRLVLMVVLGDDNLILARRPITKEMIELNSARHFNMVSDASIDEVCGTFLRNVVYENSNGQFECGPDIIRLRRRFEVLNGVSENTRENFIMRCMSYCCMLGGDEQVNLLIEKKQWPIHPRMWYEYGSLRKALAHKYKCTESHVDYHKNQLISYMDKEEIIEISKLMFVEKGH